MEKPIAEDYLGDGVYVSWDGWNITLDLRAQPPTTPITKIVLEPPAMSALIRFKDRCYAKRSKET